MESALRESLTRLARVARRESAHAVGPEDESKQIIATIQVRFVFVGVGILFSCVCFPREKERENEDKLCVSNRPIFYSNATTGNLGGCARGGHPSFIGNIFGP